MKNSIMVIFGGSGDLTKRKLMPALFNLFKKGRLNENFRILAAGRTEYDDRTFRLSIRESLILFLPHEEYNESLIEIFLPIISYHTMNPSNIDDYISLKEKLTKVAGEEGDCLYYLATPPSLYEIIPPCIKKAGLNTKNSRVIVEKPFGYDLESAKRVNSIIKDAFDENQIYRIDHFLGKETVQNILAFRFANGIFEPLWNRNYIEKIEITAVENLGIGDRGRFYDSTGALRDMVQNHLIQLLALVAMEPPIAFNESEFRNEVVKVYRSLDPIKPKDIPSRVVRGQYIASGVDGGKLRKGYRDEKNVNPDSHTETFLAVKLFVSNWRWDGVPFYIRTGKQMPTKVSEIVIHFKPTPHKLFSCRQECPEQNQLIIRIQPNEGAVLKFDIKVPGSGFEVKQVPMEFTYDKLGGLPSEDAYSKLIEDCMNEESVLFTRSDAVEASWAFFDPIIEMWKNSKDIPLYGYPAGTWGPLESNSIIDGGKSWTNPCKNLIDTDLYCEL